jgi:hypothetical protein
MMTMLLSELRSYLEQLLDDLLDRTGMTIGKQSTREGILCQLQDDFVHFFFMRLMDTLPPFQRGQFTVLLEQGASNKILEAFAECYISDIPMFVSQVLQEFRAQFLHVGKKLSA